MHLNGDPAATLHTDAPNPFVPGPDGIGECPLCDVPRPLEIRAATSEHDLPMIACRCGMQWPEGQDPADTIAQAADIRDYGREPITED